MTSQIRELHNRINDLKSEWRQASEASLLVRADLERLRGGGADKLGMVHVARLRLEGLEVAKARFMEKIEELEFATNSSVGGSH